MTTVSLCLPGGAVPLRLKTINVLVFIISGGQVWISRWHDTMPLPYVLWVLATAKCFSVLPAKLLASVCPEQVSNCGKMPPMMWLRSDGCLISLRQLHLASRMTKTHE
jgi:hypothetical protein